MARRRGQPDATAAQLVSNSWVAGAVNQVSDITGDVYFFGDRRFGLEPFGLSVRSLTAAKAREAPSRLLRAELQVVPFTGRETELQELSAWRDQPGQCSVRLIHGPGGQGKSRLLGAFALACDADGWQVAQARLAPLTESAAKLGSQDAAAGLLVVVDHAERWPAEDVLAMIETVLRFRLPVRVLLAARPVGRWWTSIAAEFDDMDVDAAAIDLQPLGQQLDRRELFVAARDNFAAALGTDDVASVAPPADLDRIEYGSVLTVHMAALAAVSARIDGGQAPADPAGISAYLLKRERARWRKLHERQALQTTDLLLGQAVFTAVLTRSVSDRLGTQALIKGGVVSAIETARQVLNDHRFCYPPADSASVLEQLHPDRLGEDFLALETPGSGSDDYPAEPWADHAVADLLAIDEGSGPPPWTGTAITVMARAAERWPHLQLKLSALVQDKPQLAIAAGGPGLAVAVRLTADRFAATDKPAEQAELMLALATRLENAGDRQAAFTAAAFAADTYGELSRDDPDTFEPELARALLEKGKFSADRRTSFEAADEAVRILSRLVTGDASRYDPYYARALNNLANSHPDQSAGLQAAQDAVAIYDRLVQGDPATYEPEYAGALGNLAHRLMARRRPAEALAVTDQALQITKRLVAADQAAFEPQLAVLLNNLGIMAATPQEGLAATSQAVEILRRLAAANPPKHDQVLAVSLDNLSLRYIDLKQDADARAASREAATVWQRLTETDVVEFEPRLAAQWLKYARLCAADRAELPAALNAIDEALAIYRRMEFTQPGMIMTTFEQVQCRFVRADILDGLGRTEEAARVRKPLSDAGWKPSE